MKFIQRVAAMCLFSCVVTICSADTTLNGVASYQDFGTEMFVAALYLEEANNSTEEILGSNQKMTMEVRLTESMSKRAVINLWMQSIAINNSKDAFQSEANNLVSLFSAIKGRLQAGDIIKLKYAPASGTSFGINQTIFSKKLSKKLFELFLRSWIGPVPPSTDFRDNILGKSDGNLALTDTLNTISPSKSRINEVALWNKPKPQPKPEPEPTIEAPPVVEEEVAPEDSQLATEATSEESALVESELEPVTEPEEEEPEVSVASLLARQEYSQQTLKEIFKSVRYPSSAVRREHQGSVRLQVELNRDGSLKEVTVVQEARYKSLNKAALRAVKKAAPFESVPELISDDALVFMVPVSFQLVN